MPEFLQLIIITSLFTWGVFAAFDEGNIFGGVRKLCEKTMGSWVCKPLFGCPYCMASIYGSIAGLFHFGIDYRVIILVFCVCGLNFIIKEYLYP